MAANKILQGSVMGIVATMLFFAGISMGIYAAEISADQVIYKSMVTSIANTLTYFAGGLLLALLITVLLPSEAKSALRGINEYSL